MGSWIVVGFSDAMKRLMNLCLAQSHELTFFWLVKPANKETPQKGGK